MAFEVETEPVWRWVDKNVLPVNQKGGTKAGVVIFPKETVLVAEEAEIASVRVLKTDGVLWAWGNNDPPDGTVLVFLEEEW